jgi:hypothetical protein
MGSALAHYEGIKAFSETDQTDDLKAITVPTLVLQGDDDQVVPYKDASLLQAKLLKNGTLKIYPGFPHGLMTIHADVINADILAFIKGAAVKADWCLAAASGREQRVRFGVGTQYQMDSASWLAELGRDVVEAEWRIITPIEVVGQIGNGKSSSRKELLCSLGFWTNFGQLWRPIEMAAT